MFCRKCGKEIGDAAFCPFCGHPSKDEVEVIDPANSEAKKEEVKKNDEDKASGWWGVLCFFVPIVGLILFLVWMDDKPKTAKKCGIGALISVILGVVLAVVYFILIFIFGPAIFHSIDIKVDVSGMVH